MTWLRKQIEESGTTQAELARAVGVSKPTMSRWVSDGKVPPARLPAVAKALRLHPRDAARLASEAAGEFRLPLYNHPRVRSLVTLLAAVPEDVGWDRLRPMLEMEIR